MALFRNFRLLLRLIIQNIARAIDCSALVSILIVSGVFPGTIGHTLQLNDLALAAGRLSRDSRDSRINRCVTSAPDELTAVGIYPD
jgi:hypothetical protein